MMLSITHIKTLIRPAWVRWVPLCILVLSCTKNSTPVQTDLHVVSFSPEQTVLDNREPVQVKFDKPVAAESEVGKILADAPIEFSPEIPVEARWIDRHTLSIRPARPYDAATRYRVTLKEPLIQRVPKKEQTHTFVHDPLRFIGMVGLDTEMAPSDPRFSLRFSQPVNGADVEKACAVYRDQTNERMLLVSKSGSFASATVAVAPKHPLMQGTTYHVRCQKLAAEKGNWPLAESEVSFATYPEFSVVQALPKEERIAPEADKILIEFATPVSREAFEKSVVVRVNGNVISNTQWDRSGSGRTYKWNSYLEAVSKYDIRIRSGLTDQFSQTLKDTVKIRFETTDAPPAISAQGGIATIEAGMHGYQIWTRNVSKMNLSCAKIPSNRIASVLVSGDLNLYPWIGDEASDVDWRALRLRSKTEQIQIDTSKNKWKEHRIALPERCGSGEKGGVYLAQFSSQEVEAQKIENGWGAYPYRVLANVTDFGVILKAGPSSGMVWVTSMSSGEPVGSAKVTIYNTEGKNVFTGTTNADGILALPGSAALNRKQSADPDEYPDYYSVQRFIAVVEKADDVAIVDGDWNSGITLWNFSVNSDRSATTKQIRGFIQSDRGIYKPGETVYFKSLVRQVSLGEPPSVPAGRANILVEDPYGTVILEQKKQLSRFGSVDFSVKLSSEARLGDYYVKIEVAGKTFSERFSVEDFRPVTFEIKKKFEIAEKLTGEKLTYAFEADYLFGAPVKDAKVDWSVQRCARHLSFSGYADYSFAGNDSYYWGWYDGDDDDSNSGCGFVSDGTVTTDAKGQFSFSVRDSDSDSATPVDYIGRATVTDETDQSVTKQVAIRAHPTDVYLGIKPSSWIQDVKDPVAVEAVALESNGKSLAYSARLVVERDNWDCSSHPTMGYSCERSTEKILSREVKLSAGGERLEFAVKKAGDYHVKLVGRDRRGKKVESSTWVWVTGAGYFSWWGDDANRMTLIPSKDTYAPGQTAVIIPKGNTEGGLLLVTVERSGIIESFVTPGKKSGEGVEIPILESYAPNVYVSIASITPRKGPEDKDRPVFAMGIVNLNVSTQNKLLKVTVETDQAEYEPGQTVRGKIRLTSKGTPVVGEVAVSVADEGVLQLINYKTPNPIDAIYSPYGLGIDSSTNLLQLARYRSPVDDSEEGADGGEEAQPKVRSKFVASAFWKPDLVTDENGEAVFEFTAPDNLTAFRVMAVAADEKDKFGSADRRITINKKLLLNPVLPRFFGSGDTVQIGAVVHNYSKTQGEVKLSWKLEGLWTRGSGETISLRSGESKRIQFNVSVSRQAKAKVHMTAVMGEYSDGFEITLPVRQNVSISNRRLFEGKTTDTGDVVLDWTDDVVEKQSTMGVSVDRFGLGMLGESLRYLVQYPYGCLEQTLSRLIPMFKVKDLATSMKLDELKGSKLKEYISFGVDKVLKHQHADGQFSLWPESAPSAHLTAYALWGLSEAQKAGVKVDATALQNGVAALRRWTSSAGEPKSTGEAADLAMAAFVLSYYGQPDTGLNARLFEGRQLLPVYGKTFLLRALIADNGQTDLRQQLTQEILDAAATESDALFIKETEPLPWYMSSDVRTTAMAVTALIEQDAGLSEIPRLIAGLKAHRNDDGRWANTQENIYSLIAFSDFVRSQEQGEATVTLSLNGKPWQQFSVQGSRIIRFQKSLKGLKQGQLRVVSDTPVEVYMNMALARETDNRPAENQGFQVRRTYLDLATGKEVNRVSAGAIVKVRLEIQSESSGDYVAVSDPLPTGCEAVNTRLSVENSSLSDSVSNSYGWDYVELRDDRVLAFVDHMRTGNRVIEYLIRATIPGTYSIPGTLVEEMYTPSHFGLSSEYKFTVTRQK